MPKILVYASCVAMLYVAGPGARAEFLYQPPPIDKSLVDKQWREAGSGLFSGVARLNEALAALELRDAKLAEQKLREADGLLSAAADAYLKGVLPGVGKNPRQVSISRLPEDRRSKVDATFKEFGIKEPPADERQAAELAGKETASLVLWVSGQRGQILKSDLGTVHILIQKISRLQNIGAATAELMTVR